MTPWLDDGDLTLYHGDALAVLQSLPAGIAQTCVTSPPYWGLRDYGTGAWSGGDESCDHKRAMNRQDAGRSQVDGFNGSTLGGAGAAYYGDACGKCGARRVDSQLGLEATPTLYVSNMVNLFREVWRVLRDDGTLWLNLGDSYNAHPGGNGDRGGRSMNAIQGTGEQPQYQKGHGIGKVKGLKPKDLVGIPWRVAFALQEDGWYLRSDIIWSKPNPMPESVVDRPTKAHEYLFLFSKQPRYFYDADAIREASDPDQEAHNLRYAREYPKAVVEAGQNNSKGIHARPGNGGRNRRSVWMIATEPFPEAHFATYPQELVRPCILAGTSEKGECVECGAPWTRQAERVESASTSQAHHARYSDRANNGKGNPNRNDGGGRTMGGFGLPGSLTIGWVPSCRCHGQCHPTRPQLVLDPFIGSGTTSLVARKHGRRSIGIDLSAEYLAIAAERTRQLSLFAGESEPSHPLEKQRGLTGGAYSPPGQSPHGNARG